MRHRAPQNMQLTLREWVVDLLGYWAVETKPGQDCQVVVVPHPPPPYGPMISTCSPRRKDLELCLPCLLPLLC